MLPTRSGGLRACVAASVFWLAGCTPPTPPQAPLLALDRTDCDAQPDYTTALPVRTQDWRGTQAVLGAAGRCLNVPGGKPTTYAVFALPVEPTPYTIEILSTVVPGTVVRPRATLNDAAGQVVRTLPPEEFEPTIAGLRAGVRPRGAERYVVVSADQARLGETLHLRLGGLDGRIQTAAVILVPIVVVPPDIPDLVRQRDATFALNGKVSVIATPARTAD